MQLTHSGAGQLLNQLHSHSCHDLAVLTYHYLHLLYSTYAAAITQLLTQLSDCSWASAAERVQLSECNLVSATEWVQLIARSWEQLTRRSKVGATERLKLSDFSFATEAEQV